MFRKNIIITGNTSGIGLELNKILLNKNNLFGISKSKSLFKNSVQVKVDFNNLNLLEKKIIKMKLPKKIDFLILNAGILGRIKRIV
mgnify:FL=1